MMYPLQIDIAVPSTTPEQRLVAYVILAIMAAAVLLLTFRSHYSGLPRTLQKHKAAYRGARADTAFDRVYLSAAEARNPQQVRAAVHDVLDGTAEAETTLRGAAGTVREELYATWVPYILQVPKTARRLAALAAVVTVLGLVAVSTDVLIRMISTSTPGVDPARWGSLAASESVAVVERVGTLLSTVPGVRLLWALVLTLVVSGGGWLYGHWYVAAAALLVGAVAIGWFETRVFDDPDLQWVRTVPDAGQVLRVGAGTVVATWLVTLVAIGVGRTYRNPATGVRWGAAAALAMVGVALLLGVLAVARHRGRLRAVGGRLRSAGWYGRAYLAWRAFALSVATIVAPLLPVWAGVAALRFPRLWGALVAADAPIQAGVVLVALVVGVGLAWQASEAWGDVRAALRITAGKSAVRSTVAAQGLPLVAVVLVYALVAGLTKSIVVGVVVAVAAGLAVREAISILSRVRYKATLIDRDTRTANRVIIEGAMLTPPDAPAAGYIRINGGTELLWPDRGQLINDAVTAAHDLVTDGDHDPTWSETHADHAFDVGITDPQETERKAWERARRLVFSELRGHGRRVPRDHLRDELADLPDPLQRVDREAGLVAAEWQRGNLAVSDEYVTLRNDPYT